MPIYEYQCSHCGHQFDLLQKFNDAPAEVCPECAESAVVRLVSAAGFQLKGSGWYATDFKDKSKVAAEPNKNSEKTDNSASKDAVTTPSTTTSQGEKN